jgi:hypothetical protein
MNLDIILLNSVQNTDRLKNRLNQVEQTEEQTEEQTKKKRLNQVDFPNTRDRLNYKIWIEFPNKYKRKRIRYTEFPNTKDRLNRMSCLA